MRKLLVPLILLSLFPWAPASAIDKMTIGTMSPKKTHMEFEGGPLVGVFPIATNARDPFAGFRPTACRTVTYCDTIAFEIDYPDPERFIHEVLFGINIKLSWDNAATKENATGNDIDLFVWGDDSPSSGGPVSKCGSPNDDDCDFLYPELVILYEPPNTIAEDAEPPAILLTVVNHTGINTGYKLTFDWFTFDIPPPPRFTPPEREASQFGSGAVAGPFDFDVTKQDATKPKATPRVLLLPGPDGELHEVTLPVYAAGQRLPSTAGRNSAIPWITAGIVGALALVALVWALVRRNRRAMEI